MSSPAGDRPQPLLEEGRTAWRIVRAGKAALLVDGADYFGALRVALASARKSVFVLGWDIDSRTPLVGRSGTAEDDAPETLLAYLTHLVERRPELEIRLLLWDYSLLYALDREPLPSLNLKWRTPDRIKVALDNCLPLGSCHHQKLVTIDGELAFCGGLDLTIGRWDTSEHRPEEPCRVDTDDEPYPPFHDVQMMVGGGAATQLAEIARERWREVTDESVSIPEPGTGWPAAISPDFEDVDVGIARTVPANGARQAVGEVRALYLRSIANAERWIYIENQYLTADAIAEAIIARLRQRPGLEVVAITPQKPRGWLEAQTMGTGQERFRQRVMNEKLSSRVRFYYPWVFDPANAVMIHAKLMIVDDRLLRVGSSNLNNRSMGVDSECDLAIEAWTADRRREIRGILCRMLGEHLGVPAREVDAALGEKSSLIAVADTVKRGARGLEPLAERSNPAETIGEALNTIADPEQPIRPEEFIGDMFDAKSRRADVGRLVKLGLAAAVMVALVLVWGYTPLADWADPEVLLGALSGARDQWWIYPLLLAAYVVGGLLFFPLTVLIAVTGLLFGPSTGFLCAFIGSMASGWVGYLAGKWTGGRALERFSGRRFRAAVRGLQNQGTLAVAALRMVPVAPFTVVNVAMGAARVRMPVYFGGTGLGLVPGIFVLTMLGDRLREAWREPKPTNILLFCMVIVVWLGLVFALQRIVGRLRKRGRKR